MHTQTDRDTNTNIPTYKVTHIYTHIIKFKVQHTTQTTEVVQMIICNPDSQKCYSRNTSEGHPTIKIHKIIENHKSTFEYNFLYKNNM